MPNTSSHVLRPGVYAPVLTPFNEDGSEVVDLTAFASSVSRLGAAGVGVLIGGTLGEGPLLERNEKTALIDCAKKALGNLGDEQRVPIIAGVTGASVRECVAQAKDAASAGADAVYVRCLPPTCRFAQFLRDRSRIVVAPAYFAFVYGKDKSATKSFFTSIADESPLPVLIYNVRCTTNTYRMGLPKLIFRRSHSPPVASILTHRH